MLLEVLSKETAGNLRGSLTVILLGKMNAVHVNPPDILTAVFLQYPYVCLNVSEVLEFLMITFVFLGCVDFFNSSCRSNLSC